MEPIKYILYCAQEANFQTRSMLIPYDKIMLCEQRVKDLQVLRDHAEHDVQFLHHSKKNSNEAESSGKEYVVDTLLTQNITWSGNHGRTDINPSSEIIGHLTGYADGYLSEDEYFNMEDSVWVDDIICDVASSGFNNIANYCNFRNKTEYNGKNIEIVEGFLVLESNDGLYIAAPVDTVDEMFNKYYPNTQ